MKALVDGLDTEEMDGGRGRSERSFLLTPERGCVVGVDEDGEILHVKTLGGTLIVEDAVFHIKIRIGDRSPMVVKGHQICNHVCQEMHSLHGGMRGGWFQ